MEYWNMYMVNGKCFVAHQHDINRMHLRLSIMLWKWGCIDIEFIEAMSCITKENSLKVFRYKKKIEKPIKIIYLWGYQKMSSSLDEPSRRPSNQTRLLQTFLFPLIGNPPIHRFAANVIKKRSDSTKNAYDSITCRPMKPIWIQPVVDKAGSDGIVSCSIRYRPTATVNNCSAERHELL